MFYKFDDRSPQLKGTNHYIAENVTIIGSAIIENNVCILPNVVIRADNDIIHINSGANVQDGSILHTDEGISIYIGKNVTIGHRSMIHGCRIGNNTLIGMGSIIMNNAIIGNNCVIGANSLILENQKIPDESLVVGSPAKIKRKLNETEIEDLKIYSQHYKNKIPLFNSKLKRIDHYELIN